MKKKKRELINKCIYVYIISGNVNDQPDKAYTTLTYSQARWGKVAHLSTHALHPACRLVVESTSV